LSELHSFAEEIADYCEEKFESSQAALCVEDMFFLWKKM
jgi:hypothetical protein